MASKPPVKDLHIAKLPISLALLKDHGGWVSWAKISEGLWPVLKQSNSLSHLTVDLQGILNEARSTCFAIVSSGPSLGGVGWHSLIVQRKYNGKPQHLLGFCFFNYPHLTSRESGQIGVVLTPEAQGKGYGRHVVHKLLSYAFDRLKVRRVVASILCPVHPAQPLQKQKQFLFDTKRLCHIFQRYGFHFEGVTRAAILKGKIWQDVHRLSILDIDWLSMQKENRPTSSTSLDVGPPLGPWEEMERRHMAERKEMREWCEEPGLSNTLVGGDDEEDTYYYSDGREDEGEDWDD